MIGTTKPVFEVGAKVAVFEGSRVRRIQVVERVMARFVELRDKSKWALNGEDSYPAQHEWTQNRARIALATDEHVELVRVANARAKLRALVGGKELEACTLAQLRHAFDVLKPAPITPATETENVDSPKGI